MIAECFGNSDLVRTSALLEGAKFDTWIKNFFKEGEDYKGLKKDLQEIVAANNMSEEGLKSKGKGFMHTCKRILQVMYDIDGMTIPAMGGMRIAASIAAGPVFVIGGIVSLVISFIVNRLMRYLVDTVEFNTIQKDAEKIVSDLRREASKAENPEIAAKYNAEAERLEKSIEKYSKK